MDRRRNRRRRGYSQSNQNIPQPLVALPPQKTRSFLNGLFNILIMTSLIALIYLMLDYHCSHCNGKCNVDIITRNVDDIAKNLSLIKDSYNDLEIKISRFSQDLPKLEGQIDILESLANTREKNNFSWDPNYQFCLPNMDVFLNKKQNDPPSNISCKRCAPFAMPPAFLRPVDVGQI